MTAPLLNHYTTYDVGSNARSENQILRGLIMASLMLRDQNSEKIP